MSLVRDYAGMLESEEPHAAIDALFSNEARPVDSTEPPLPLEERFDVMPADPTQASAVARARNGKSFIIQGPPGTGKSQTITNLIADYVACGKRVLFVCEKRAAIDVVYHRLKMQGLSRLSCLIHDSQSDKKAFIKDLKETYEEWIARSTSGKHDEEREGRAAAYGAVLGRAHRFRTVMQSRPAGADVSVLALIDRTIELASLACVTLPGERLPTHRELLAGLPAVRALEQGLRAVGRDARFGRHPLRLLSDDVLFSEHPVERVTKDSRALLESFDAVLASPLARVGEVTRLADLTDRCRFVSLVRPLIEARTLRLLDASGEAVRKLEALVSDLRRRADALAKAATAAAGWRSLIPADEVTTAITLARRFEGSLLLRMFGWLSPTWWRLRGVLRSSFDFASKTVPPSWSEVLERLKAKYDAEGAVEEMHERGRSELHVADLNATWALLEQARAPARMHTELCEWLVAKGDDDGAAELARVADRARDLERRARELLRGVEGLAPSAVRAHVGGLEREIRDLPTLLEPLRRLAAPEHARISALVREEPVDVEEIERAVCNAGVEGVLRERALDVLGGADWDALKVDAQTLSSELRRANGHAIVERAQTRFLENVRMSNAPADALDRDAKAKKKAYASGRKELEHEFGKVTGILVDDAVQHARPVDEVVQVQPSVLAAFGWRTTTVLHTDWWSDRELVLRRIETALG